MILLLLLLFTTACAHRTAPLPVYGQIPDFTLSAENGESFDRHALDGKVWVADFIYTTCPGPCPRMSALMRQVQQISASLPGVMLVSFTVDPEHDTPPVLAEYARRYRAQPGRWRFLTGRRETLQMLSREAFKLGDVDGSLNHSTRLVLVDRKQRVRGYYGTTEDDPVPRLVADIKRILGETS